MISTTGRRPFLASLAGSLWLNGALQAQQAGQAEPYVPKQSDRPEPITGDEAGFKPLFDGKSLDGWEGDPKYWRIEEGSLVGEVTPETLLQSNTFVIWRGGTPKDFELKVDYRITAAGNSGINYRSVMVPNTRFALRGYQCDIDGRNAYTGNNYEERGRLFLALRGQMTHVVGGRKPIVLSSLGDNKELGAFVTTDWNAVHLTIRGNQLVHTVNGHVMSIVVDDDAPNRTSEGLLGVQVHVGPPMKVEYRNFRLKTW
jgi:hypothetical protein